VAEAANRRPLTSEARVGTRVSPCGTRGGQSVTATGTLLRVLLIFPVSIIPPYLSILIYLPNASIIRAVNRRVPLKRRATSTRLRGVTESCHLHNRHRENLKSHKL
jgi:hypothetical protein